MKKNIVKINENTLRQIVAESVKTVLEDNPSYYDGMYTKNEPAFGQYANFERKTNEAIKDAYYSLHNVSARLDFEQKFPENVANVETAKELQKIMAPCLKAFDEYINS